MSLGLAIGSLFSGIGGLELGLERAGLGSVAWQCEIDPWARRVLAKHWPDAERFDDVKSEREWPAVDLICGGFPCQDVSSAGRGAGLAGARSGLWFEFRRVVAAVLPAVVVVENVASGRSRWLPFVCADLEMVGYRTRAIALSAAQVGAPHPRARVFVVATDPNRIAEWDEQQRLPGGRPSTLQDARQAQFRQRCLAGHVADHDGQGQLRAPSRGVGGGAGLVDGGERDLGAWWAVEPAVGRVVHGLSGRLDRLRGLGNAVVPQCAEVIGLMIRDMIVGAS